MNRDCRDPWERGIDSLRLVKDELAPAEEISPVGCVNPVHVKESVETDGVDCPLIITDPINSPS